MSYVEAATADPAASAARARQTATDIDTALGRSMLASADFASIFATARSSAWLDGLMSRQSKAIEERTKLQSREKKTTQAEDRLEQSSSPRDAGRQERSEELDRPDEVHNSRSEKRAETERETEAEQRPQTDSSERTDRRPADEQAVDQQEQAESEQSATEPSTAQTDTADANQFCSNDSAAAGPIDLNPAVATLTTPAVQAAAASEGSASTARSTGLVEPQFNLPVPTTPTAPAGPVVSTSDVALAAVSPTAGENGGDNAGTQQDAVATPGSSKGSNAAPKQVNTGTQFSTLLGQVGRERMAAAVRQAAGVDKPVADDGVKLSRSEGIEQLARVMRSSIGGRNSSMTLRLDPPELGQLKVDIRMNEQNLVVRFQTETRAAQDLLQTRLGELRHALEQHGVQLDRVDVEIRPSAQPGEAGRESDGRTAQHDLPHGGEPDSGQARSQQDGARESYGSQGSSNQPLEGWQDLGSSGLVESRSGEIGASAETGVDLIV